MFMSAYEGMCSILDINETIEALKEKNSSNTPDLALCKATELLAKYRSVISELMMQTEILKREGERFDSQ